MNYILTLLIFFCKFLWPASYIVRCKENEIESCGPNAANAVFPFILHGDPKYGIPSLIPFQLGETEINEPHMKFHLRKCELSGLETSHVYKME